MKIAEGSQLKFSVGIIQPALQLALLLGCNLGKINRHAEMRAHIHHHTDGLELFIVVGAAQPNFCARPHWV